MPVGLCPFSKLGESYLLLVSLPGLLPIVIKELAEVQELGTNLERSSLRYDTTFARLNLLHIIKTLNFLHLLLQRLKYLQSAQLFILLD